MKKNFRLPTTPFQRLLNILSVLFLLGMYAYILLKWPSLPQKIPSHWGIDGKADAWSGKGTLLVCPILCTFAYFSLLFVSRIPGAWNLPVTPTEANRDWVYQNTKSLILSLRFVIIALNFYVVRQGVHGENLSLAFLPVFFFFLFAPIVFFCLRCRKAPTRKEPDYEDFDIF